MPGKRRLAVLGQLVVAHDRATGVVFATYSCAPFIETLVYNAHVGAGKRYLRLDEYLALATLALMLWLLMIVSFIVDVRSARAVLQSAERHLVRARRAIRTPAIVSLVALPAVVATLVLGGRSALLLQWFGAAQTLLLPLIQLAAVASLVWVVAALIRAAKDISEDLAATIVGWAFCLRMSIGFFLLLTIVTLVITDTTGIRPQAQVEFRLAIAKDYLLLFIISGMLYLGLFRLALANNLVAVFRSLRGFVEFLVICALIAILAIWADFNSTAPQKQSATFLHQWQSEYNVIHVYLRDIGFLLMPIAWLLFWTLHRAARELREGRHLPT